MNIREITIKDREPYRQLRSMLDQESEMWGALPDERASLEDYASKQFERVIAEPRSLIFVAEDKGELIGFLSLETPAWQSLKHTSTLMVGVLENYQGKGLASRLFEAAEDRAKSLGIHRIELLVMAHNSAAINLYQKLGYKTEGIRRESSVLNGEFVDEIYMAKIFNAH